MAQMSYFIGEKWIYNYKHITPHDIGTELEHAKNTWSVFHPETSKQCYTCHLFDRKIWDMSISVPKYEHSQLSHETDESLTPNVETMSFETQLLRHACLRSLIATSGCTGKPCRA